MARECGFPTLFHIFFITKYIAKCQREIDQAQYSLARHESA